MKKPRIFISHSTPDEPGRVLTPEQVHSKSVRDAIAESLEAAQFSVLLDRIGLKPGDRWASKLTAWMTSCDAAVAIISDEAIASDFVASELSVLSVRADTDRHFTLIPVRLVDPEVFRKAPRLVAMPMPIPQIQWVGGGAPQTPAGVAKQVVDRLKSLRRYDTPMDRSVRLLRGIIADTREDELRQAADLLDIEIDAFAPEDDPPTRVSAGLLAAGVPGSRLALNAIAKGIGEKELRDAVDVVTASWVNSSAAERIQRSSQSKRAVQLNAQTDETAQLYVRRACPHRPSAGWPVRSAMAVLCAEKAEDNLKALEDAVRKELLAVLFCDENLLDEMLKDQLDPIFIVLKGVGVTAAQLTALRGRFPNVVFFVLADGPDLFPPAADVDFLHPRLEDREEEERLADCRTLENTLTRFLPTLGRKRHV
jgi:hypothetical protein